MANPEHLAILKQGVDVWNKWRSENSDIRPDLSGTDLFGMTLRKADLSGTDLFGADLRWTVLSGADLGGTTLSDADLSGADLRAANLGGARCLRTQFANLDLSQVIGLETIEHDGPSYIDIHTLWRNQLELAQYRRCILRHEIGFERRFIEIVLKSIDQVWELGIAMIMTDMVARLCPDMFLRIQVRTRRGKENQFQAGILLQHLIKSWTMMPRGTVQQEQNGLGGEQQQEQAHKICRNFSGLFGRYHGKLPAPTQVKCAIEMDMRALGGDPNHRCLTNRCPYPRQGRLEIEAHLVHREKDQIGVGLQPVSHFFSNSASKSATT